MGQIKRDVLGHRRLVHDRRSQEQMAADANAGLIGGPSPEMLRAEYLALHPLPGSGQTREERQRLDEITAAGIHQRNRATIRTRYLYDCPRGFANETSVYRITTRGQLVSAMQMIARANHNPDRRCYFIRRTEAEAHCRANRRQAKSQMRAGLNLHQNPVGACEIVDLELG